MTFPNQDPQKTYECRCKFCETYQDECNPEIHPCTNFKRQKSSMPIVKPPMNINIPPKRVVTSRWIDPPAMENLDDWEASTSTFPICRCLPMPTEFLTGEPPRRAHKIVEELPERLANAKDFQPSQNSRGEVGPNIGASSSAVSFSTPISSEISLGEPNLSDSSIETNEFAEKNAQRDTAQTQDLSAENSLEEVKKQLLESIQEGGSNGTSEEQQPSRQFMNIVAREGAKRKLMKKGDGCFKRFCTLEVSGCSSSTDLFGIDRAKVVEIEKTDDQGGTWGIKAYVPF
ncbi:Hypothetical protein NTJ_13306 [Nesidiocoris tenuis]|uniref:Uncharacterized protein n=1 Tax=Nesidiocoris tenuis TaxID=355587 RepID=A0ABN7B9L2_9HEMI|nr:Hypothetical protein NTJ_13306 [Nesidiocoris tenuis]